MKFSGIIPQFIRHFFVSPQSKKVLFVRPPFGELAPGIGRAEWQELIFDKTGSQDRTEQNEGLGYYAELAKNPDIFAGLRQRACSVARLWVSAGGLEENEEGAYYPKQLLPFSEESQDQEVWEFVADVFDNQLEHGFRQVIENVQQARLTYGRSVQELDWQQEDGKIVLRHIWDRDPQRFFINPPEMPPGVYLKSHTWDSIYNAKKMPDRKFWVITQNARFENPYGTPELTSLIEAEFGLRNIYRFFARHLERHGSPLIDATYPREMEANTTWQTTQLDALKRLSSQSIALHSERIGVNALEGSGEISGFLGYIEQRKQEISLVLTGSPTALKEGQFGTYGQSESKDTRAKSLFEQDDSASFCEAVNYCLIPWLVDFNFPNIVGYPFLQLIEPERITPTTPRDQEISIEDDPKMENPNNDQEAKESASQGTQLRSEKLSNTAKSAQKSTGEGSANGHQKN